MKHRGRSLFKRSTASFVLAFFISQLSAPVFPPGVSTASAATVTDLDAQALRKDQAAWDDVDGTLTPLLKSNVLFLVESTATMAFSPKGVMPTVALNRKGGESAAAEYGTKDWTEIEGESANWAATYKYYGLTLDNINNMMAHATYGMGALPAAWSGKNINRTERNLYGRDIDESNNWKGSRGSAASDMEAYKNDYYFPFAKTTSALKEAFEAQTTALQSHFRDAPLWRGDDHYEGDYAADGHLYSIANKDGTAVNYGFTYKGNSAFSAGKPLPYALVFKNPAWWESGPPAGATVTIDDLVPNDSRMYQAKLVLWRLMEEPNIFQSLRVGLATTYLNPVSKKHDYSTNDHSGISDAYDIHGVFRVPPFGSNLYARTIYTGTPGDEEQMKDPANYVVTEPYKYYPSNTSSHRIRYGDNVAPADLTKGRYINGIMTQAITGQVRVTTRLHGQYVPVWATQTNEPLYGMAEYTTGSDLEKSKQVYRLLNRGSLHVPIRDYDAKWKTKGTTKEPQKEITQSDKIRMWINGLADIKNDDKDNQFHYFKDPEIGICGVFSLPSAIFPDDSKDDRKRSYLATNSADSSKYIVHSDKSDHKSYKWHVYASSTEFENPEFEANSQFIAGSGEATGSVMDFFSPYSVDSNLADASYPIRSTCEDNWLIVIASGIELKKAEEATYSYESWEAIKKLYDYTANNPVYMLERDADGNPLGKTGTVVAENDSRNRNIVSKKLDKPIRTLVIGLVPTTESVKNEDEAIRNQVKDMRENLNKMARAGQGKAVSDESVNAFFADDVESLEIALREALQLIIDSQRQPAKGTILESPSMSDLEQDESFNLYSAMFRIRRDNQWEGYLTRFAVQEGEDEDGELTLDERWELADKIKDSRGSRDLRYWNGSEFAGLGHDDYFKSMTGLDKDRMNKSNVTSAAFESYPPEWAMYDWLQGYDHSYYKDSNYDRLSMLAEMGQGGIAFVSDPVPAQSLPGYYEWASGLTPSSPDIYLQTNDGILHIVDPSTGGEKMAIVPPPVLIPSRLTTMKTRRTGDGLRWLDVSGPESKEGQDILASRSVSAYTLDGALQKRAFPNSDGSEWKLRLLAGLGRGGSGLYMLNVGDHDNPKLMWYKERIGDNLLEMTGNDDRPAVTENPSAFMKLGFNSPKAAMGVTGSSDSMLNFIAMAGGMQNEIDPNKNGGEGAVLLMLDPENGKLIRGFGAADVENWDQLGTREESHKPAMGMMISEPTLLRTGNADMYGQYLTGAVYAADNRGTIFKVALEKSEGDLISPLSPVNWNIRAAATLHPDPAGSNPSTAAQRYAIPFGVQLGTNGNHVWLAGGTTDLRGRISESWPTGVLSNTSQMIFAFRTERYGNDLYKAGQLKSLRADFGDTLDPGDLDDGRHGWKIPLLASSSGWGAEYVSAKSLVADGVLYIATFREDRSSPGTSQNLCETKGSARTDGEARLYILDLASGRAIWPDEEGRKYFTLEHVKITGITLSTQGKNRYVFFTYDKMSDAFNLGRFAGYGKHLERARSMYLRLAGAGSQPNLEEGENVVQYWLKN
jgi:Tfp pilus tip-associated adhesin PilY1